MASTKMRARGMAALATCVVAGGMLAAGAGSAHADIAPGTSDVVGVGSDTLQYMLDFGTDGDFNSNPGYNSGKLGRVFSFDATPDANARAGYLQGSVATTTGIKPLNPTIVMRAGNAPVQRPNGSGGGINALIKDTGSSHKINFVRMSSFPSAQNLSDAAAATNVGTLHVVRLAHETLGVAAATTTNAVPLTSAQLFNIYECNTGYTHWNDASVGGTSPDTIIPVVPQPGSGTRKTFLQDIGFTVASDGSTTPALGGCVKTYEENDPYALYLDSSGNQLADPYATSAVANPDAIEPMSSARLNMYLGKDVYGGQNAHGYFYNPNVAYGATPPSGDAGYLTPGVKLLSTAGTAYSDKRGLYVVFRDSDVNSTAKFNGTNVNWAKTLFVSTGTTTAYFDNVGGGLGAADEVSAGVSPDYADCGANPSSASACGAFGPDAP